MGYTKTIGYGAPKINSLLLHKISIICMVILLDSFRHNSYDGINAYPFIARSVSSDKNSKQGFNEKWLL